MIRLLCLLIGYVFGLFQTGYIVGKIHHTDIREHGSGNAGTTNTLRTLGKKAGAITLIGDLGKAMLAYLCVYMLFKGQYPEMIKLLCMYACAGSVLGHIFPIYLGFKGGKGIATICGLGIIFGDWWIVLSCAAIFFIIVGTTRYVSLGSICLLVLFMAETIVFGQFGSYTECLPGAYLYEWYGIVVFISLLAIYKHRENIVRLIKGTENKLGRRK